MTFLQSNNTKTEQRSGLIATANRRHLHPGSKTYLTLVFSGPNGDPVFICYTHSANDLMVIVDRSLSPMAQIDAIDSPQLSLPSSSVSSKGLPSYLFIPLLFAHLNIVCRLGSSTLFMISSS